MATTRTHATSEPRAEYVAMRGGPPDADATSRRWRTSWQRSARCQELADRARALGYRPLEAETERLVADLQKLLGRPALARAAYEQAQLAAEAGRDDRAAAAIAIELLDVIGMKLGETDRIESLRKNARALLERIDRPPELEARLLEISGSVETRAAQFAAAERDLTMALALRERLSGKTDLSLTRVLHELAYLEIQRAHVERACPYIERALAIDKATLGDQHPDTAEAEELLGGIASETGQYAEAEQIFQRSLAIYTRETGPDSTRVAGVLATLARVYLMQGKPGEALALYRRASAIYLRDVGPRHEMTLWTQIGIATGLQGIGQKAEAHRLLLRVIADARTALGPEHQTIALALETITRVELELRRYDAARAHMQEAFAMYRHVIGNDYGDADTLRLLGEADLGGGHLATAIEYLEEARRKVTAQVPAGDAALDARWIDGLLGRALYESGRDRARGLQLVMAAWSVIARAPGDEAKPRRVQLAAWMKAHGIPTPP